MKDLPMSLGFLALLAACQHTGAARPAVLEDRDALQVAIEAIGEESGERGLRPGGGDPLTEPVLSVIPPGPHPLEGRSMLLPRTFDITIRSEGCILTEREGGLVVTLPRSRCREL